MPIPYVITTLLYVLVALLAAVDVSMVTGGLAASFAALRWVRVHFITLGIITQFVFGLLPSLSARLANKPRPAMRWDIWLSLNAGFITLLAGFASVNRPMILAGGSLVFLAAALLVLALWQQRLETAPAGMKFYITGVFYLLVGIIVGTGLWLNWSEFLRIQVPLEVHIHANSWGFMSLVFAGLLADFTPLITRRPLATEKSLSFIYWGMTIGALGLVLGPWIGSFLPPTIAGLILHLSATIWLLISMFRAFKQSGHLRSAGSWHLLTSYLWILAPVLAAPLILAGILKSGPIEATAPQALIYGWVLQFGIALIPFILRHYLLKAEDASLGGGWLSLSAATAGSLLVWMSIFLIPIQGLLYSLGFAFYALALIMLLRELIQIARLGLQS